MVVTKTYFQHFDNSQAIFVRQLYTTMKTAKSLSNNEAKNWSRLPLLL